MGHKAVSHGRFFKNNTRKYFFLPGTCFHVFYTRSRTELGSLFSEYLRSFGERYLDPFFFLQGHRSNFLRCCHFRRKKSRRYFQPSIHVSYGNGAIFLSKSCPKLILRKLECDNIFQNFIPKKWQSGVGCLSRNDWWDFKKSGPDSPVSRVKHACKGVEISIFSF